MYSYSRNAIKEKHNKILSQKLASFDSPLPEIQQPRVVRHRNQADTSLPLISINRGSSLSTASMPVISESNTASKATLDIYDVVFKVEDFKDRHPPKEMQKMIRQLQRTFNSV